MRMQRICAAHAVSWNASRACSCKTTMVDVAWSGRRLFLAAVLLALLAAGLPPPCSAARKRYSSNWLVEVRGGWEMADIVARRHNLSNSGQVRAVVRLQPRRRGYMQFDKLRDPGTW